MILKRLVLCLALLAGLILTCVPARAEGGAMKLRFSLAGDNPDKPYTVTVAGRVLDGATGRPIPGAQVRGHIVVWRNQSRSPELFEKCPTQAATANQAGEYTLKFVTPLTTSGGMQGKDGLCVYACAPGYETRPVYAKESVTPKQINYPNFDVKLDKGKVVRGQVVDEDNRPVVGALVRIQNGSNGDWNFFGALGQTTTDKAGAFQLNCCTEGDVITSNPWLLVFKKGYGAGFYFGLLQKGDLGALVLHKGGAIRGRVVDGAGRGLANCEVSVHKWPVDLIDLARTDAQGRYVLSGIPGEPTIFEFYKNKNGRFSRSIGEAEVYVRMNPRQGLSNIPSYKILVQDGKTTSVPDVIVDTNVTQATGRLIPSRSLPVLKGLLVRLDGDWNSMAEVNAEGRFYFPLIPLGKHRLTVYLPNNLRYDRGIGRVKIEVKPGQKLEDMKIALEELAEVRVQILDTHGSPLEGITAGATWGRDGSGGWTEGTVSGPDGWALLYLYPGAAQYVRGFDMSAHKLVSEGFVEVCPKPCEVINNVRLTMVAPATLAVRVQNADGSPAVSKPLLAALEYADGTQRAEKIKTDAIGRLEFKDVVPGAIRLSLKTEPAELAGRLDKLTEVRPGEIKDLGTVTLAALKFYRVRGKLAISPTFASLEGFKIRLDLEAWQPMVPTDAQGNFTLEKVPAGKHRLTAYLPFNRRTDRGVGHAEIEVKDADVEQASLPLETLATVKMKIQDPAGKPLEDISAAAWWSEDHSGVFTEGTRSDKEGRATLYLYPGEKQYLGAHDWGGAYKLKGHEPATLKPGQTKELAVTMEPGGGK